MDTNPNLLAKRIVDSSWFQKSILILIIAASIIVGLETSESIMQQYGKLLYILDKIIIYAFTFEAVLKMLQHGKKFYIYFTDSWNIFDFLIVLVFFLPGDYHFAAVLRLARIFRILRLISVVPKLQLLVRALLKSIPSMVYVSLLLGIHFYVYAVLGVFLWSKNDPSHFSNLPTAFITLFRIITLEDWTDIMYVNMLGSDKVPFEQISTIPAEPSASPVGAAIYFISFVVFGTMIMLNLFIGVIINSMNEAQKDILKEQMSEKPVEKSAIENLEWEMVQLEEQITKIKELIKNVKEK
jgi:voltage-gated sodium channel